MKVFVYGTLMSGFGNNILLNGSKFIGNGVTKNKYTMRSRGIPFVNEYNKTSNIKGEVYEVSHRTLRSLDALEGHPDWYYRKEIDIELEDGDDVKADIYFNEDKASKIVESGNYREI
jgi:gamma-glutamylaminecyclotransferase